MAKIKLKKTVAKTDTVAPAKQKTAKLSVARVREISDSLDMEGGLKIGSALQKFDEMSETKKRGKDWLGRTPEESKNAANRLWDEGEKDKFNAARYRSLANAASKKK